MNRAETLDEALSILVGVGRKLLGADRVSVAVWDERLTRGNIAAVSGLHEASTGYVVEGKGNAMYEPPPPACRSRPDGGRWNPRLRLSDELKDLKSYIAVPFLAEGNPTLTFQSGWLTILSTEDLEQAVAMLSLLGSLTRIAYRANDLRVAVDHEACLEAVLDAVEKGGRHPGREHDYR